MVLGRLTCQSGAKRGYGRPWRSTKGSPRLVAASVGLLGLTQRDDLGWLIANCSHWSVGVPDAIDSAF